jgi:putative ABC transport system permease protein
MLEGTDLSTIDAKEVTLGEGLARSLELKVGSSAVLLVSTASGGVNAVEVTVVGIFSTITKAYDDFALRMPLKTAQTLLRVNGVHSWLVLLDKTSATESMVERMREKIQAKDIVLVPWYETAAADFYNKTVSLFSKQVLVVNFMIALIIILSISSTMMSNVRERLGEIGTCMALGDSRRTVLRRFLVEGAVLGFFGGVAGTIIGVALAQLISRVGIPMPPPPGMASSYIAGIKVTPGIAFNALLLAVLTAFIAGILPAWKACRMPIADALRHAR